MITTNPPTTIAVIGVGAFGTLHARTLGSLPEARLVALADTTRPKAERLAHFVRHRPARTAELFPEEHPITLTMVHDLYVAAQMAGGAEPESLDALDALDSSGRADHAWSTLRWSDGRVATFHSHWILPDGAPGDGFDWLEVFGQSYHTQVSTNPQDWTWTQDRVTWPAALEMSRMHGRPTGMLAEELRSFLAACQGAPVPAGCRLHDAVQVQRWMEQLLKSAQSRRAAGAPRPSPGNPER